MIANKLKIASLLLFFTLHIQFSVFCQQKPIDYSTIKVTLDKVLYEDQTYRLQFDSIRKVYGSKSKEVDSIYNLMDKADSINQKIVINILDNYGWPDTSQIGVDGNLTIWAIIHHTPDLKIQKKYLPLLKKAVKNGFEKKYLAFTVDRIALQTSKLQTYGTQLYRDSGKYIVYPIKAPFRVDKRRKKMGLEPLAFYLSRYNIIWDPKEHKKQSYKLLKKIRKERKKYEKQHNK